MPSTVARDGLGLANHRKTMAFLPELHTLHRMMTLSHVEWENAAHGTYILVDAAGENHEIPLRLSALPTREQLQVEYGLEHAPADMHRNLIELQLLAALAVNPAVSLTGNRREVLLGHGLSARNIDGTLRRTALLLATSRQGAPPPAHVNPPAPPPHRAENVEGPAEGGQAWVGGASGDGHSLLSLLYYIAEDQARREGFVHRGVTCNSCGIVPIRGIRYRCANCMDFDLCETCEQIQPHFRTHLFYKVRIPAPFLGNPRQAQPVWYPGRTTGVPFVLPPPLIARLARETGYENVEVDAMWEQFRVLAATKWREETQVAIDRDTFDKCFSPPHVSHIRSPRLIYDRIFAFYDVNGDGLIDFEEFVKGLASLNSKNKADRLRRVYQGYDIDGDGYVDRKDFLRMFRAYYALAKELSEDMLLGLEEEDLDGTSNRELILGSQPISAFFSANVPPATLSRIGEGKRRNAHGDMEIVDGQGVIRESRDDTVDRRQIIAEAAERQADRQVHAGLISHSSDDGYLTDSQAGDGRHEDVGDGRHEPEAHHANVEEGADEGIRGHRAEVPRGSGNWRPGWVRAQDGEGAVGSDVPAEGGNGAPGEPMRVVGSRPLAGEEEVAKEEDEEAEAEEAESEGQLAHELELETARRQALEYRWRRRQFYVDEEEGFNPPEGYQPDDATVASGEDGDGEHASEADNDGSHADRGPLSPRSRSSSKVRFRQDYETGPGPGPGRPAAAAAAHETRSNPSTSSRSIPFAERWGGYEIPQAEKDVGREIMYQVTQQGLNELLDPLFQEKEDLALEVLATKAERNHWRHLFRSIVDAESDADGAVRHPPRTPPPPSTNHSESGHAAAGGQSPSTNAAAADAASLPRTDQRVLHFSDDEPAFEAAVHSWPATPSPRVPPQAQESGPPASGLSTGNAAAAAATATATATGVRSSLHTPTLHPDLMSQPLSPLGQRPRWTIGPGRAPSRSGAETNAELEEYYDPTLPHHRPDHADDDDDGHDYDHYDNFTEVFTHGPPSTAATFSSPHTRASHAAPSPPSVARLAHLQRLDAMAQEIQQRGGPGRVNFEEFESLMNGEFGKGLGFLGSWVEMASF
ncbi:MAG: hypothetical protein M1826_001535 [Phylliscum demangeonii]|nr:MAG: hypothetical protein M1826_001535 [Phylliscum demangeonii]